ncbi:MAG: hypothetical protein EBS66_15245 [Betaproteobacteria bacterium]|nr:hypothetical protein [Betaproteobacteria bacterium]
MGMPFLGVATPPGLGIPMSLRSGGKKCLGDMLGASFTPIFLRSTLLPFWASSIFIWAVDGRTSPPFALFITWAFLPSFSRT